MTETTLPRPAAVRECAVCQGTAHAPVLPGVRESRFAVLRCQGCGLEFLDPLPTWEEIQAIYTSDYYKSWDMAQGEQLPVAAMKKNTFRHRFEQIRKVIPSGRVLDVGTASGFFLDVAREFGYDPYGVEVSEYAGGIAREKFGADHIHIGVLETAPFPDGFFDVIAMSDLIEHVQDPAGVLRVSHRLLKPDGRLMIVTPDTGTLTRRLMGTRWTHYKLEHLHYFDRNSLGQLAAKTGFAIDRIQTAPKCLTIKYLRDQLAVYQHPVLTPVARVAGALLKPFATMPLRLTIGEMLAFLKKA